MSEPPALHEAICPACLETVIDMAGGNPSIVPGWCPHRGMGYLISINPGADPQVLQAAPMTEAEADALRDRVAEALRPRRPGTLNA